MILDGRFSRNEGLFGEEGQARISRAKVAIVGLGGLGSHVSQQLGYIGVQSFALIDFDIVSESSLNRLVGAVETDVAEQATKIAVAERTISQINSAASVELHDGRIADAEARRLVNWADVVFGCVDRDVHRLELIETCAEERKPYFDLASDTNVGEGWYGGRVVFSHGDGCLLCLHLLDQEQISLDRMSAGDRQSDERIYGVNRAALGEEGPSVVSLNGVVASVAVTEFMVLATRLRKPFQQLTYRGDVGTVTKSLDVPERGCFYCGLWRAGSH